MILITTSREPKTRTRIFCNLLAGLIPNSKRFNRGTSSLYELYAKGLENYSNLILLIDSKKGNPSRIRFFEISEGDGYHIPLELYIKGIEFDPKQSKRKFVNNNYTLSILVQEHNKNIMELSGTLAKILKSNIIYLPQPVLQKIVMKKEKNTIGLETTDNTVYMIIMELKKSPNILFSNKDFDLIGPKIILNQPMFKI